MRFIKLKNIFFVVIILLFIYSFYNFPFSVFENFSEFNIVSQQEFENLISKTGFTQNKIVEDVSLNSQNDENIKEYIIKYKLFNLINIKNLKVKVSNDSYYAGGDCVGFNIKSDGIIIMGGNYILTQNGKVNPFKDCGLNIGDVIIKLNDWNIHTTKDIIDFLSFYNGEDTVKCTVMRDNVEQSFFIKPEKDIQTNSYKLGIWIKDTTLGIGTLTFISDKDNRFGALGHAVNIGENTKGYNIREGSLYNCKVMGIKTGSNGKAGHLLGSFSEYQKTLGSIDKNCEYGMFGNLTDEALFDYLENKNPIEVGGRATVKPGKAQILSCIDGKNIKSYDIEIIKTNFQRSSNEKSMVIRVVDEELLKKTGGIVQGMSGSPIIQDGKLVGAVTHVFLNDSSKGFGIYIDWMIEQ